MPASAAARPRITTIALVATLGLAACATRHVNATGERTGPQSGHRLELAAPSPSNGDGLYVALAFSGGGMRAAALAYGVLAALRDTPIPQARAEADGRLLDEVDFISANSGGSFTAAYYGLFRDETFRSFDQRLLERNLMRELILRGLRPDRVLNSLSATWGRTDIAAAHYAANLLRQSPWWNLATTSARTANGQ